MESSTLVQEPFIGILCTLINNLNESKFPDKSCLNCATPLLKILLYAQRNSCFLRGNDSSKNLAENITSALINIDFTKCSVRINKLPPNSFGNTALHYTALLGYTSFLNLVHLLNSKFLDQNNNGETPIHLLVKAKALQRAIIILDNHKDFIGCEINPTDNEGLSHFHIVCILGKLDYVKAFINHNVDINLRISDNALVWPGCTPLHIAIQQNYADIVNLLLNCNAKIDIKDARGINSEQLIHSTGFIDKIDPKHSSKFQNILIMPDEDEELPPLLSVCESNDFPTIQYVLKQGKSPNTAVKLTAKNYAGYSALHFAVYNKNKNDKLNMIHELPEDYDLEAIGFDFKRTDPKYIIQMSYMICNSNYFLVKYLVDNGSDVNQVDAKGMSPLHIADMTYNNIVVDFLLSRHEDITHSNPVNYFGYSHFHIACKRGNLEVINLFLQKNVDINHAINQDSPYWPGYTGLHFAVELENIDLIQLLIEKGANTHVRNSRGETPLHISNKNESRKITSILLNCNEYLLHNYSDNFNVSYFHISCANGHLQAVENHLVHGVPSNLQVDEDSSVWPGCTGLHLAAMYDHIAVVRLLLEKGADVSLQEANGLTPLHYACKPNDEIICNFVQRVSWLFTQNTEDVLRKEHTKYEIVKLLVNNRDCSIVNKKDRSGKTPIFYTFFSEHMIADFDKNDQHFGLHENRDKQRVLNIFHVTRIKIIKFLLERGAVVNEPDEDGLTVLHLLVSLCFNSTRPSEEDDIELLELFIHRNANLNSRTRAGISPLHIATKFDDKRLVEKLILYGSDLNCVELKNSYTPLHLAGLKEHVGLIKVLVSRGADVNIKDKCGQTVLHKLLLSKNLSIKSLSEMITLLARAGININSEDADKTTPLHLAAARGEDVVIEIMTKNGANVYLRDRNGRTALHRLSKCLSSDKNIISRAMNVLIENGIDINARDKDGNTALHLTKNYIDLLIQKGADINIENNLGLAPPAIFYDVEGQAIDPNAENIIEILKGTAKYYINEIGKLKLIGKVNKEVLSKYNIIWAAMKSRAGITFEVKENEKVSKCKEEIEEMKQVKLNESCTLYNILYKTDNELAVYVANVNFINVIDELESKFKRYNAIIRAQYLKGCIRKKLLAVAEKVLMQSFGLEISSKLSHYCCRKIVKYLSNDDLYVLINDFIE